MIELLKSAPIRKQPKKEEDFTQKLLDCIIGSTNIGNSVNVDFDNANLTVLRLNCELAKKGKNKALILGNTGRYL
jgi:hypothetical protein